MGTLGGSLFRRLWVAAAISYLGDGIGLTAFPLLVASLTRDPILVAGATIALDAPWLLFALPGGALVDRVDRRLAMVSADSVRAVVVTLLAVLALAGNAPIWAIYAVALALSSAATIFDPASEAIVPLVVDHDAIPEANSRLEATSWTCNFLLGPPLGASLFAVVAAVPFLLDGASFVASALIVFTLPGAYRTVRATRSSIARDVGDGLHWLIAHPVLRYTSALAGITNLASTAIIAVFVLFAQDVVGVTDLGYGLLLSCIGFGGIVGAIAASKVVASIGSAGALRLSTCLGAPAAGITGAIPHPVIVALAVFAFGFSISLWNVTHVSLRQQLVPNELRGRVAASNRLITWGSLPIGAALGGVVAGLFGLRAPMLLAAILLAFATLVAFVKVTPSAIATAQQLLEAPAPA